MDIYIDVVFLENMAIDMLILIATGIIAKEKIRIKKIVLGSAIGGILTCVYLSNINTKYLSFIVKLFTPIIMMIISFRLKEIKKLIKLIVCFFITTFIFGGASLAIISINNNGKLFINNGILIGRKTIFEIAVGIVISITFIIIFFKLFKDRFNKEDLIYDIAINLNNKKIYVKAMLDTGNLLKEPITNVPVIVVERDALKEVVPVEILNNIDEILGGDLKNISIEIQNDYLSKLKIIPFMSVGKTNGVMLGIKADKVVIEEKEINKAIIGIYDKDISRKNEYRALIGLEMIKN